MESLITLPGGNTITVVVPILPLHAEVYDAPGFASFTLDTDVVSRIEKQQAFVAENADVGSIAGPIKVNEWELGYSDKVHQAALVVSEVSFMLKAMMVSDGRILTSPAIFYDELDCVLNNKLTCLDSLREDGVLYLGPQVINLRHRRLLSLRGVSRPTLIEVTSQGLMRFPKGFNSSMFLKKKVA